MLQDPFESEFWVCFRGLNTVPPEKVFGAPGGDLGHSLNLTLIFNDIQKLQIFWE